MARSKRTAKGCGRSEGATRTWLGLATVAIMRDDAKGALAAYDALLAKHPSYAAGQLGRAWALAKLGKKDEARAGDRSRGGARCAEGQRRPTTR